MVSAQSSSSPYSLHDREQVWSHKDPFFSFRAFNRVSKGSTDRKLKVVKYLVHSGFYALQE
jgi:hypothetical protein